ncbi:hypothetical protein Plhal304r1_c016g0058641 [Plasmopara halstedii]
MFIICVIELKKLVTKGPEAVVTRLDALTSSENVLIKHIREPPLAMIKNV